MKNFFKKIYNYVYYSFVRKTLEELWKEQESKYPLGWANPKGGWRLDNRRWSDLSLAKK